MTLTASEAVRHCYKCDKNVPATGFRRQRRYCRDCERVDARASSFLRTRGITHEQRDGILERQGNRCAACGSCDPGSVKGWHVDHCHQSNVIRGVLCAPCNVALGSAKDSVHRLLSLVAYLEKHTNGDEE